MTTRSVSPSVNPLTAYCAGAGRAGSMKASCVIAQQREPRASALGEAATADDLPKIELF